MTQLTLTLDDQTAAKAERLAKNRHTSVSAIMTELVRNVDEPSERSIPPGTLTGLVGIIKAPLEMSNDELILDAILDRHVRPRK